jgi:polyisoprenoid-binding protein YceI
MGIATVRGEFHNVQGAVLLDESDITKSSVSVTMDTASVDTREPARDKHLRSADFFDAEKYPAITFQSTRVEPSAPGKLKITGDLTIHGVTKSVVLDADAPAAPIQDPWGNLRTASTATVKINRQDFGVKWNGKIGSGEMVVSDDVSITLDIEMTRKPAPEPAK